jgi:hypothetical protein
VGVQGGGQVIDAHDEFIECPVEGVGAAGAHRVGDRPVQAPAVGGKFFVGVIADRDDQVGRGDDVIEVPLPRNGNFELAQ